MKIMKIMVYLEEELLGSNLESFDSGSFKVLSRDQLLQNDLEVQIKYLFLSDVSHESVDFISLLDEPSKDTGGV
jgi:hypothetical protein